MRLASRHLLSSLTFVLLSGPLHASDPAGWVGTWEGDLDAGGLPIPTVFHLALDEEGALGGTVDSPAQNVFGLEITEVRFADDGEATIVVGSVGARYVARREEGELVGEWRQRGATLPLVCTRDEPERVERVAGQEGLVGSWEGTLDAGAQELRVRFHLKEDVTGRLVGTMDSPDQGARGIPVTRVTAVEGGGVVIDLKSLGVRFEGTLADGGDRCRGTFEQGGRSFPLALVRIAEPEPPRRPQTPAPPFPYLSEDVTYENKEAGVTIAGTLTLPAGSGPVPAALLISGSGAQDRDETVFDHKPFLVLADHLSRRGVAVLRVDDRGVGGTSAGGEDPTSEDFAGDVLAGVRYLRGRREVDPSSVGLIGHSEGGLIAPMAAARAPDAVAFVVLLAAPGVTGEEILLEQGARLARAAGRGEEAIGENRRLQERLFAVLKEHPDASREEIAERLREVFRESSDLLPPEAAGEAFVAQQVAQLSSAWMRLFVTYDPRPALAGLRCPVLALIGEHDLQVPADQNLPALTAALREGGVEDVTVREVPALNHLFQTSETGAVAEYDRIEETFAPAALEAISEWIDERFGG